MHRPDPSRPGADARARLMLRSRRVTPLVTGRPEETGAGKSRKGEPGLPRNRTGLDPAPQLSLGSIQQDAGGGDVPDIEPSQDGGYLAADGMEGAAGPISHALVATFDDVEAQDVALVFGQ